MNTIIRQHMQSIDGKLDDLQNEHDHIKHIMPNMLGELAQIDELMHDLITMKQSLMRDMEVVWNRDKA